MSEEKQLALLPEYDFTMKDMELIKKFKDEGLLGLAQTTDVDVERFMGLYLDGKTYRQISTLTKKNKAVILFLAHKFKWPELREQYLEELKATLPQKILDSKLQSQEFFLELMLAYRKKISKNVHQYLRTDNMEFMDKLDQKDITIILKVTELLHRLDVENLSNPGDKSLVSLNGMGEGVNITRTGTNSVEITPKSPFASKLKQFADLKRAQEKDSQPPPKSHDINVSENLTPKENEDDKI